MSATAIGSPGYWRRAAGAIALLAAVSLARAGQEALQEEPVPENAREASTPLEKTFKKQEHVRPLNWITDALRKALQDSPAVIRDSQLVLKPRTYYFDREQPDGTIKEAWAGGGSLEYKSGLLFDRLKFGAELYTSQPIYAPADRDGTLLLKPGQEGYTVLGQLYAEAKLSDTHWLTLGRSVYSTPYVNQEFNRMTPNTFEGASLQGSFKVGSQAKKVDYLFGYLSDIKQRNSDQFIPMSQAAGGEEDHGTLMTQLLFSAFGASIGLAEYYTPSTLNILYAEATFTPDLKGPWDVKFSVQGTDQRSLVGPGFAASDVLGREYAARATVSRDNAVFSLAVSKSDDQGAVVSPFGASPSYTKGIIKNTARPGEAGVLTSLSYSFKRAGLEGLSAVGIIGYYWDAQVPGTGAGLPDERELDFSIDYKVPKGFLHGLWFRVQRNWLRGQGDDEATREWRVILNWEIPLL